MLDVLNQPNSGSAEIGRIDHLHTLLSTRQARVGVVGMGYVGMPLALAAWTAGFEVLGFDVDDEKVRKLNSGVSYLVHITSETVAAAVSAGRLAATTDFAQSASMDVIVICVPTPLTANREPDLTFVERTCESLAAHVRQDQLIILESTTWPGTTAEVVRAILERSGLSCGTDFFLGFSPEREDPGNCNFGTQRIPKVVGADDPASRRLLKAFYDQVVDVTIPVSSSRTAEAVKLTENIFRAVNIALMNELKVVYDALGIDVWEVISAASTKPFGYMPFYPGPGLGGHCIPIDPFYLTWKAREHEISTRFIELAGEINTAMPHYVVEKLAEAFDRRTGRGLRDARILLVGMSYKKNVDDIRESASLKLMRILEGRGAQTHYFDPYIPVIPRTREYPELGDRKSVKWTRSILSSFDVALVATDHDNVDYIELCQNVPLVIDTRNACERKGVTAVNVVKA
ncbi:nucleotide sugar dehydrogenase [Methylobacterium planeticum]|uniref:Nucleotide sugar dehydrogenase n=1 Tax=Methylobacterium planeticum TaxID=2615211 RepID=A0A6N6MLX0_9HYPH|nr:nucleotide sugar dehydrogenase [Methylobacterium planeticum]KAB1070777.1 nucleotide sugar dehydrogenase [Methylobacterium planeticum]